MTDRFYYEAERAELNKVLDEMQKEKSFFSFRNIINMFKADLIAKAL